MKNQKQLQIDIDVLESAVRLLTRSLNDLVKSCYDDKGKLKTPEKQTVIQAQKYLPAGYSMTFIKKK